MGNIGKLPGRADAQPGGELVFQPSAGDLAETDGKSAVSEPHGGGGIPRVRSGRGKLLSGKKRGERGVVGVKGEHAARLLGGDREKERVRRLKTKRGFMAR